MEFIEAKLERDITKIEVISRKNKKGIRKVKNGVIRLRRKIKKLSLVDEDCSLALEDRRFFKNIIPEQAEDQERGCYYDPSK